MITRGIRAITGTIEKRGGARNRALQLPPALSKEQLLAQYAKVRRFSEQLCETLVQRAVFAGQREWDLPIRLTSSG